MTGATTTVRSTLDGTELATRIDGPDDAPAIVLLHSFPLSHATWDAQAARLASRARVIRYDLRGLGASGAPMGPYLVETLAGDLSDVLDAAGVARAVVVGHSIGGYAAYAFFRMFPERVRALGIVQASAAEAAPEVVEGTNALADRIERGGTSTLVEVTIPVYLAKDRYASDAAMVARLRSLIEETRSIAGAAAALRGSAMRVSSEDLFDEIRVPVTIVAGAHDALASAAVLRAEAAAIPGARYDELDCGHLPQWEAPEALASMLERLLDDAGAV